MWQQLLNYIDKLVLFAEQHPIIFIGGCILILGILAILTHPRHNERIIHATQPTIIREKSPTIIEQNEQPVVLGKPVQERLRDPLDWILYYGRMY